MAKRGNQQVIISVLADTKKMSRAFKNLSKELGLTRLGNGFKNLGSKIVSAFKTGTKVVTGFGIAMAALALKGGFDRMLAIEDAEAKLKGLGHSAQVVDAIMDDALASVKGTAFGLDEAATLAATAVAAGIEPGKELVNYLSLIGDAATISGADLQEMGSIFGKIATSGRAQTQELNQLADRGIPIWTALADHYGVAADELRKMVSQGKVDGETFQMVMDEMVGGAALEAGNTTRGAFANMRAALSRTGAALLDEVFPMFKDAFSGITEWLDGLTDRVKPVGKAFATWIQDTALPAVQKFGRWIRDSLLPVLQTLWDTITGAIKTAVDTISGAFKTAGGNAKNLGKNIGDFVIKALETLGPILEWIIKAIGNVIAFVIRHNKLFIALAAAIGGGVAAYVALNKIIKIVRATQMAFNMVMNANPIVLVTTAVAALTAALVYFFTQTELGQKIWENLVNFFKGIASWFTDTLAPMFQRGWEQITGFFSNAWDQIKTIWSYSPLGLIVENWDAIIDFFKSIPKKIGDAFKNSVNWLKDAGKNIINGLWNGIQDAWRAVSNWFTSRPAWIRDRFTAARNWLVNGGKNILRGLWDGLKDIWSNVSQWFRDRIQWIKDRFTAARNWLVNGGKNIIRGIRDGLLDAWSAVRDWFRGRPRVIKGWFSGAGRWLIQAGKNVMNGFFDGVKSGWNLGKTIFSTITRAIPGLKGPKSVDLKMLVPAGRWIMQGFRNGIEAEWPNVQRTLGRVTDAVAATQFDPLSISASARAHGRGSAPVTINVYAMTDGPDVGRRVHKSLQDYYRLNGVR